MNIIRIFITAVSLIFYSGASHAIDEILFGPEFTFTELATLKDKNSANVILRMYNHLVVNQPDGAKFTRDEPLTAFSGHFTSPNGWTFVHHTEGGMVLEIGVTPGTPEFFRQFATDMQDAIFVSAANEGFFPALFLGGGHINVSIEPFFADPLLFRNFIVDLWNHNELFMGVFGYDTNNALPLQLANENVMTEVADLLWKFDGGMYRSKAGLLEFARKMDDALNVSVDPIWRAWHPAGWPSRTKYQAVNFNKISAKTDGRLELRGVRPQASMDVWVRQIELLNARIRYLEKVRVPIPLRTRVPFEAPDRMAFQLNPPIDPQLALREFYGYVRQSGESWENHRDYLWPKWIMDGELARFESSSWFQRRQRSSRHKGSRCELILMSVERPIDSSDLEQAR